VIVHLASNLEAFAKEHFASIGKTLESNVTANDVVGFLAAVATQALKSPDLLSAIERGALYELGTIAIQSAATVAAQAQEPTAAH
jgi:hypothetical protein